MSGKSVDKDTESMVEEENQKNKEKGEEFKLDSPPPGHVNHHETITENVADNVIQNGSIAANGVTTAMNGAANGHSLEINNENLDEVDSTKITNGTNGNINGSENNVNDVPNGVETSQNGDSKIIPKEQQNLESAPALPEGTAVEAASEVSCDDVDIQLPNGDHKQEVSTNGTNEKKLSTASQSDYNSCQSDEEELANQGVNGDTKPNELVKNNSTTGTNGDSSSLSKEPDVENSLPEEISAPVVDEHLSGYRRASDVSANAKGDVLIVSKENDAGESSDTTSVKSEKKGLDAIDENGDSTGDSTTTDNKTAPDQDDTRKKSKRKRFSNAAKPRDSVDTEDRRKSCRVS